MQVEKQLIRSCFVKKVLAVLELFNFIKFHFHETVNRLDVRLHAMCTGEYRVMPLAGDRFDGFGVG